MPRHFGFLSSLALAACLLGCASTYNDGTRAAEAKNYALAEQLFIRAIQEGDSPGSSWNNLGHVYMQTNRSELAMRSFVMAARYGNEVARLNLTKFNKPVPAPDLAGSPGGSAGTTAVLQILNSGVQGYNDGRSSAASRETVRPSEVKCETSVAFGGRVDTTCKQK